MRKKTMNDRGRWVIKAFAAIACFSILCAITAPAADWPQYRGANQDGICTEKVNLSWPASGPKVIWKVPLKNGFSSFAISGKKAYTEVNCDLNGGPREILVALDADSGKELWFADLDSGKYKSGGDSGAKDNSGGDGPRSTPTVNDGKVYAFTQNLILYCFDAETGKKIWIKDLIKENSGRNAEWNSAASPVIDGDLVFVAGGGAGQTFLGINKKDGKIVWKSGDEHITHSTPVVGTIQGVRQVIFFCQSGLVSVAAKDGKALWNYGFPFKVSTAISPVVSGDIVYCSAGYGVGSAACKIAKNGDAFTATELWKSPGDRPVANHWSTPVCKDGYLYGMFSFKQWKTGPMKCVELATGKVKWEQPGFGPGNVILVGDKILALSDDGRLVVAEASPSGYKELAQAKVLNGKCWTTPALSDGRIYIRSAKEGACLDVKGE
ncbi:MAG: PQQ-like beta-propeller repeat protein [Candidatus Sumerlaeota bacterium]|nr:PQQ-like beta-propeller repeat protein [Candidatus Sumerlaeota bacterium]